MYVTYTTVYIINPTTDRPPSALESLEESYTFSVFSLAFDDLGFGPLDQRLDGLAKDDGM